MYFLMRPHFLRLYLCMRHVATFMSQGASSRQCRNASRCIFSTYSQVASIAIGHDPRWELHFERLIVKVLRTPSLEVRSREPRLTVYRAQPVFLESCMYSFLTLSAAQLVCLCLWTFVFRSAYNGHDQVPRSQTPLARSRSHPQCPDL